ncbi:hypothetical protein AVEN_47946-1 [Araneus ventricosus]|uniref:Uncharacterized protein n=1 Tax=Araneus ventricosus TaxID=182803 RepID=A0A4Y2DRB1_ARAVE|nr:hypothetical protein AVEN_47946-1 [Araneus ventricosus]
MRLTANRRDKLPKQKFLRHRKQQNAIKFRSCIVKNHYEWLISKYDLAVRNALQSSHPSDSDNNRKMRVFQDPKIAAVAYDVS